MRLFPVVLIALLLGGPCVPNHYQTKAHADYDKAASHDQQQAPPAHASVTSPDNLSTEIQQQKRTQEEKDDPAKEPIPWFKKSKWVIVFVTAAYAVVTFITLLAILYQASIASKAVKFQMDAERARLLVTIGVLPNFIIDPSKVQIMWLHPEVQNHGRSPATITKMRLRAHQVACMSGLPKEPVYDIRGNGTVKSFDGEAALPPGARVCPLEVGVDAHDFVKIRQGTSFLYLYGVVEYQDIAKRNFFTRFCFLYHVPSGFNPIAEGFVFGGPKAYNRAI
jgi:hypothetical protein